MDIVAEFREQVPLEDFPGIPHAWVNATPNRFARLVYVARPDGQALFQINAKHGTDWEDMGAFVRFAQANMAKLTYAAPMVAVPGLALRHYRFDSAIAVLPAAADLSPSGVEHLDQRVYGLFPGWQCEVSMTESEGVANRRYRRDIEVHEWTREPRPFIGLTYGFKRTGEPPIEHRDRLSTDLDDVRSTIGLVTEAESGWLTVENWQAQTVDLAFAKGKGLTWGDEVVKPEAAGERLRRFVTEGR